MTVKVKEELSHICQIIAETVDAEKIYLFGSYAYGTPSRDSDYDLCVLVSDMALRPADAVKRIRRALFMVQGRGKHSPPWNEKLRERGWSCMNGQETWSSEWLDLAEMDLGAAEYLLGMRPVPVEIICYHCEQAAEKMLKGTLAQFGMEPPKTHDLIQLCKLCMERDPQFEQLADACVELTPYGVQVRYPSHMELDESDMNCALRECRKIREFVLQRLDPHISQDIKAVTEAKRKFEQHMG